MTYIIYILGPTMHQNSCNENNKTLEEPTELTHKTINTNIRTNTITHQYVLSPTR